MTRIAERFEGGMRCLNALTKTCDYAADICAFRESTDTVSGKPIHLTNCSAEVSIESRDSSQWIWLILRILSDPDLLRASLHPLS